MDFGQENWGFSRLGSFKILSSMDPILRDFQDFNYQGSNLRLQDEDYQYIYVRYIDPNWVLKLKVV